MANKLTEDKSRCPSCEEQWIGHLGVAATCGKFLRCKRALELIMKLIELNRSDITQEDISAISEICKRVLKETK